MHATFACHLVLIWMMLVASLIDADEKVIPDSITVPGTLLGLLAAAACPWSLLPDFLPPVPAIHPKDFNFLTVTAPCPGLVSTPLPIELQSASQSITWSPCWMGR